MRSALAKSSVGLLALLLLMMGSIPTEVAAAETRARWHISDVSFPSVLVPGSTASTPKKANEALPQYLIQISNIGASATNGEPITVAVKLPTGISASPTAPAEWTSSVGQLHPCEAPLPDTVVCKVEGKIESEGLIGISLPVDVGTFPEVPALALSKVSVSGGGAPTASSLSTTTVGGPVPTFGFRPGSSGLTGSASTESGLDANLAGEHPYIVLMEANFPTRGTIPGLVATSIQALKSIEFSLPPGFAANPQAPARLCTASELQSRTEGTAGNSGCPAGSQVGRVLITTNGAGGIQPLSLSLYALKPVPGVPAEFGFNILGVLVHVQGGLDGAFHLTAKSADILARYQVLGIAAVLWGDPSASGHDPARFGKGCAACALEGSERNKVPFITMPTSCHQPLVLGASAVSWDGGPPATTSSPFQDSEGNPLETEGCSALAFEPTIESRATTTVADSPSGLEFAIHQPQSESIEGRATAALKNVQVTLPEGMTVNAAGANGLEACSQQQMGYAPVGSKIQFQTTPQSCPNAAKVGTLEVKTPLLGHELPGSVYVAKPFDNPFGSLLALYLAIEDEESGIIAKLAGKVEPDPQTGRLTAIFTENPALPLESIKLHVFKGPNATLKTPLTCGTSATATTLTPWSTPEGLDVHLTDSFQVQTPPAPGPCPGSEAQAPNSPTFSAGTITPLSGAFSPVVVHIARADGTQRMSGIDTMLPEGLTGKAAGVPYCPESDIALAKSREAPEKGKEELASPSCPAASEVGTVQVTAGAGIAPFPIDGRVYWAGPYKGAPLSVVVIVPGVAGPFDLGNVVSRVALYVGLYDARIHAVSDPLPTIIDGIPLDVRSIDLRLNRSDFSLNPTSCEPMSIEGSVSTPTGATAPLKNRFQVGECGRLGFKPSVNISLKGATKRSGHPTLKAVVTYPKKGLYANIARAQVALPHSEFLDQGNLNLVCKQADLTAGTCPKKAIYGKVKAWTPLLEKPLTGNVYLGVGFGYKLPAIVAELNGQIRVLAKAKVDTTKENGIRTTFEAVPDAPLEKFVLEMKGGKKYGLLQNSENICKKTQEASGVFEAHNGKTATLSPVISISCKGKPGHKKGKSGHKKGKKKAKH